jgi:hypothetical protein
MQTFDSQVALDGDEEEDYARAVALSREAEEPGSPEEEIDPDDATLAEALALSMESGESPEQPGAIEEAAAEAVEEGATNERLREFLDNHEELKKVLQTLPGVNANDPRFDPKNQKRGGGDGGPKPG